MRPKMMRTSVLHACVHSGVHLPSLAGDNSSSSGAASFLNSGTNPEHHSKRPSSYCNYFKERGGDNVVHFYKNLQANLYPCSIN